MWTKEQQQEYDKKYYQKHRKRILRQRKEYRQIYREKMLQRDKEYYQKHRKTKLQYKKEYFQINKKERNQYGKQYRIKRRKIDIKFRLDGVMATNIYNALRKKKAGRKWESLVGYTLKDLIKRIEFNFDNKMSWNNYGFYWQIDHKKPKSLFRYTEYKDQAFKDCWCLANLQPMEKIENIKKSNKFF